jgi:23S rRNA pseudouridine2605 synthase
MVSTGRVAVNGQVVTTLPILIDAAEDRVSVDDQPLRLSDPGRSERAIYIVLYKPAGVLATNAAQGEQVRAVDLLPPGFTQRVYPVGRLDRASKGLLLLTNDGDLTHRLTHPRFGVPKTYRASVDGFVEASALASLQRSLGGGKSQVRILKRARDRSLLEITLREGRNPQIRRTLAKLGHKTRDLTRIRFGPLTLTGLSIGDSRMLAPREAKELKKWLERPLVSRSDRTAGAEISADPT